MTTYTLTGIAVHRGQQDSVVGVTQNIQFEIVMPDTSNSLSYTLLPLTPGDDTQSADISIDIFDARISGADFSTISKPNAQEEFFVNVTSGFGNATVFGLFVPNVTVAGLGTVDTDFLFVIDGALPPITTAAQWQSFEDSITSVNTVTGAFGPGVSIPLTSFGAVVSQNDLIVGEAGNDVFAGGAGDDTIQGLGGNDTLNGGAGNDIINGGAGNDFISPGDNTSFDFITAGTGNDTISFSELSVGYVDVEHSDLSTGITVQINGNANTGFINKGVNGTTLLIDVANPIAAGAENGGLGVFGTNFDDTFDITSRNGGWMSVTGLGGNDTFTIGASTGTLRLDYSDVGSVGVQVNLATGIVANDGFGGTDTIQGPGRVTELRTSMLTDVVTGSSSDESFILMAGSDTLDAGGGFDRLRYDRSGVEAVTVDLAAGTATGIWNGVAFSHTIANVEHVRGSRNDNDILRGDGGNNRLDGRGGDDSLFGGLGNDTLIGGDGNDTLNPGDNNRGYDFIDAGAGNDVIDFSGAALGYFEIGTSGLSGPVTATIDGQANTGSISKGTDGTTTLTNVARTLLADGLGLFGTAGADIYTLTVAAGGFMQVHGSGGNDTFNLDSTGGLIRINYERSGALNGITANLATGVVTNDGFGNTDQINRSGGRIEIGGTDFADNIIGSAGDDSFILRGGADTLDGGAGFDRLRYDRSGVEAVAVDLSTGTATGTLNGAAFTHTLANIEHVRGSNGGDDILTGNDAGNFLEAQAGNDTLKGGLGDDTIMGGEGTDTAIYAGTRAAATVSISGMTVTVSTATGGTDTVTDVEKFQFDDGVFDFNITSGIDLVNGVPGVIVQGTDLSERLLGTENNDTLIGGAGNDRLDGGAGNDVLDGGLGNDRYIVDSLGDVVVNEIGFSQGGGIDTVESSVSFVLPRNVEILRLQGTDNINGTGGFAPEAIVGNTGNNVLDGGGGYDVITAKAGDDTLIGGLGADSLVGDEGNDVFLFNNVNESRPGQANRDFINGFVHGEDRIDLSTIDANVFTTPNDAFVFVNNAAFSGAAGEVRWFTFGGGNYNIVEADVNGDRVADMQIFVNLTNVMFESDFIF